MVILGWLYDDLMVTLSNFILILWVFYGDFMVVMLG